jgi:hypothetical protein
VEAANLTVTEIDLETVGLVITVEGSAVDYQALAAAIERAGGASMFIVDRVAAMEVLDSRGRPTVAARVVLGAGEVGRTQVPSGASTGKHEAVERRDGDPSRYGGAGVLDTCQAIESEIAKTICGRRFESLASLDQALIELDGTPDKRRLATGWSPQRAGPPLPAADRRLPDPQH